MLLAAVIVAVAMLAVAIAGLRQVWIFPRSVPVIPLLITGGFTLITYSAVLHSHEEEGSKSLLTKAQFVALSGLIAGGVFWAWGSYAATQGEMAARHVEDRLAFRTDVSVFSAQRLGLTGPGIRVDEIGNESSLYRFRYTGLRMLLRSDDRYFLLPTAWQRGRDSVFVLLESKDLRVQFIAPPDP